MKRRTFLIGVLLMPLGLVRHGDFSQGTPISLPKNFGTPVTLPKNFGNIIGTSIGATSVISENPGVSNDTPAIVQTTNGNFLLVYNQTHFKMIRRSFDQGATWSAATAQWDANTPDPTLALTPGGDVIVEFGKNNLSSVEGAAYARSTDQGVTWSGFTFFDNPVHNTIFTPTLYLNDGGVMYASGYGAYSGGGTTANIWKSIDDGLTWTKICIAIRNSGEPQINETSIAKVGPTKMIAVSRVFPQTTTYVHFSNDMGITWGTGIDYTAQLGVILLPQLLQTPTALLLFGKDQTASSLVVFASYDGGVTFTDRTVLDAYPSGVDSTGYCWPILLRNGDVYVVWSAPTNANPTYAVIKALTL